MRTPQRNLALLSKLIAWAAVCIASLLATAGLLMLLGFFGLADADLEEKVVIGGSFILAAVTAGLVSMIVFALRTEAERRAPNRCVRCDYDLRGIDGACPECGDDQRESSPTARVEN